MRFGIASGAIATLLTSCALFTDLDGFSSPSPPPVADDAGAGDADPEAGPVDDFGLGDGRDGPLEVVADAAPNAYLTIDADVAAGATRATVDDSLAVSPGDVVLVWQTTGVAQPAVGAPTIALGEQVGRWELARIAGREGPDITFEKPLAHAFAAGLSQVVRVPQYTDVIVREGATLTAGAWDGRRGGVLAFFASGLVVVDGRISAEGTGFRGGPAFTAGNHSACELLDGTGLAGYAAKGEGLYPNAFAPRTDGTAPGGRGSYANGGGGGGGAGQGGAGGNTYVGEGGRPVGGMGGAGVVADPFERFVLGGGGGAGEADSGPAAAGGRGGGAIYVRARRMRVGGEVTARGLDGETTKPTSNGGGGGGGGGIVVLDLEQDLVCDSRIEANGGKGGDANSGHGPGGGGAGGQVALRAATAAGCLTNVAGGEAGKTVDGVSHGATPGAAGIARSFAR